MAITEAVLGVLSGGLTSVIPGVLEYFKKKEEFKNENEKRSFELNLAKIAKESEEAITRMQAFTSEGESLRDHDSSLVGGQFINTLRASVRPVITYLFFAFFVAIKSVVVIAAIKSSEATDWVGNVDIWVDLLPIIWDPQTSAIFGAIMGFWFGSRAIEKMLKVS